MFASAKYEILLLSVVLCARLARSSVVDDLLAGFSAFHAGYRYLEYVVLFYSPYVEVGGCARWCKSKSSGTPLSLTTS